jgi:phage-related protein
MADMFGSAEAGKAAATIAQHAGDFDSALADMRSSAGATEEAFKMMDETAAASFEKMKTSAVNSLMTIGEELLPMIVPVLQSIAGFLQRFGEWFSTLDDGQKKLIITILAIIAAIGPLLIVIGKISTGVSALMAILPMLSGPVGIVIAVIAALVAIGVLLYKNWDKIKETASNVWNSVSTTFGNGVQKVKDKVRRLAELPREAFEWGRDFIEGFARGIREKVAKVVDAVKGVGAKIRRFLHFSRPDEGPLHEYEEWPRDFVEGYAHGIRSNIYRITDASEEMAAAMAYPTGSGAAARSAAESSGIMSAVGQDINRGVAALTGLTVVMDTGQTVGALAPKMTSKVVDNITKDWRWK